MVEKFERMRLFFHCDYHQKSSRKELLSLDHQIIIDDDQIDAVFNNVGIDFSQVEGILLFYVLYFQVA